MVVGKSPLLAAQKYNYDLQYDARTSTTTTIGTWSCVHNSAKPFFVILEILVIHRFIYKKKDRII